MRYKVMRSLGMLLNDAAFTGVSRAQGRKNQGRFLILLWIVIGAYVVYYFAVPRNPGVVADCTGDNAVGSIGPRADGFET